MFRKIAFIALIAACSSKPTPAPVGPPPEPQPVAAPEPAPGTAPAPAPAPTPPAGPDRAAVIGILDQIDTQLAKASKAKGHDAVEHADELEKLVDQLDQPLAGFAAQAPAYAKLKEHSKKFHEASRKGAAKDAGEHHHHMVEASKELRATL